MRAPFSLVALCALSAVVLPSCGGPEVDLTKGLQVLDATTGWHDAGIQDGYNKIVPSITFKVKNVSDQALRALQVNVLFKKIGDEEEWGSGYLIVAKSEGLAPGAVSGPLTVHSQKGLTGIESRAEMLRNSQFVDARVQVFGKYGSVQWTKVGEFQVERTLLNP
jgi:hypothetical protein